MICLIHFDWAGNEKELDALLEAYKRTAERVDDFEYTTCLQPWNDKYHYTMFLKMKNVIQLHEFIEIWMREEGRDHTKMLHCEYKLYS